MWDVDVHCMYHGCIFMMYVCPVIMLYTLHLHCALHQLYLNKMGSIKWEGNKKAHAQHLPLWTGLSALYGCEHYGCLWHARHPSGSIFTHAWELSPECMAIRRVLLVSQPGLQENCYQEDLSNLPPALVFISSSVKWKRFWVSKTFFECQIFCVWRWQWIIGRPKTESRSQAEPLSPPLQCSVFLF